MTGPAVPTTGRRAVILFETLLSLALFVGTAVFALQATRSVLGALDRARREALAVDLARARLAELETSLVTIAELRENADGIDRIGSVRSFGADAADAGERWTLTIRTERTEFTGLTLVEITVREAMAGVERGASCTLRQLVRLRAADAEAYEEDPLLRDLPEAAEDEP